MLGNVFEWTEDCWNENYNGAPNDGSAWVRGDCSQRVVRGGSFDNNDHNQRCGNRNNNDGARPWVGFRLASTPLRQSR